MPTIADSRFWRSLLEHYPRSPSIAMCRVPEVELFSRIALESPVLDHCGGDGYISSLAFDGRKLDACVDLDEPRLEAARRSGRYESVVKADVGKKLPFADRQFATVLNNSGIEHVPDLRTTLREINRVLKVGGKLHLNVLNQRWFDNWPLDAESMRAYRDWQPFYHALSEQGWSAVLAESGFGRVSFTDYFSLEVGRILAELDYRYSRLYLKRRASLKTLFELVGSRASLAARWDRRLGNLRWDAEPGKGAAFTITAERTA